eukprot:854076_1
MNQSTNLINSMLPHHSPNPRQSPHPASYGAVRGTSQSVSNNAASRQNQNNPMNGIIGANKNQKQQQGVQPPPINMNPQKLLVGINKKLTTCNNQINKWSGALGDSILGEIAEKIEDEALLKLMNTWIELSTKAFDVDMNIFKRTMHLNSRYSPAHERHAANLNGRFMSNATNANFALIKKQLGYAVQTTVDIQTTTIEHRKKELAHYIEKLAEIEKDTYIHHAERIDYMNKNMISGCQKYERSAVGVSYQKQINLLNDQITTRKWDLKYKKQKKSEDLVQKFEKLRAKLKLPLVKKSHDCDYAVLLEKANKRSSKLASYAYSDSYLKLASDKMELDDTQTKTPIEGMMSDKFYEEWNPNAAKFPELSQLSLPLKDHKTIVAFYGNEHDEFVLKWRTKSNERNRQSRNRNQKKNREQRKQPNNDKKKKKKKNKTKKRGKNKKTKPNAQHFR